MTDARLRPAANPVRVHGTTLDRSYTTPEPGDEIALGDIVAWRGFQWDVAALSYQRGRDGELHQLLMLERRERLPGKGKRERTRLVREHALAADVVLMGRQILLPGTPEPEQEIQR
jgi:hypothetical protein